MLLGTRTRRLALAVHRPSLLYLVWPSAPFLLILQCSQCFPLRSFRYDTNVPLACRHRLYLILYLLTPIRLINVLSSLFLISSPRAIIRLLLAIKNAYAIATSLLTTSPITITSTIN